MVPMRAAPLLFATVSSATSSTTDNGQSISLRPYARRILLISVTISRKMCYKVHRKLTLTKLTHKLNLIDMYANASEDELTRRRRDGDDGGDRDEARANDDQAGIEQARTTRVRLGPHRTARSDNPKLKQRGRNDATSNGKRCWKRIPTP